MNKRIALAAACLLAAVCFLALGIWQIERRVWKLDLIQRVDARIHAPAAALMPPAQWSAVNERDDAYRKVRLAGTFRHDCETLVPALTELGVGFWLLTPLETKDGAVLINRGFVPPDHRNPQSRQAGLATGEVIVAGLMRMTEPKGTWLRSNDPAAGRWYSRDASAILHACGIAGATSFFIDADATPNAGGYPAGGLTVVSFRNNHVVYAATWFTLCLMAMAGTIFVFRSGRVR